MNSKQLKNWKEEKYEDALKIVSSVSVNQNTQLKDVYPEFNFHGSYSTSLDPYVPLWALLPYYDRVVVGVLPYLKSEEEFIRWYGVSVKQMIYLQELGRLNIRLINPGSLSTLPKYLNPLYERNFPTTHRDYIYHESRLGEASIIALKEHFKSVFSSVKVKRSIDSLEGNRGRTFKSTETAYIHLASVGGFEQLQKFDDLIQNNPESAMQWLEYCRLLLVGPEYYSFGGIHSVADKVFERQGYDNSELSFPSELGRLLVEFYKLFEPKYELSKFGFKDTIDIYENSQVARNALLELSDAVKNNGLVVEKTEDLKEIVTNAKKKDEYWMRGLRVAAATGLSAAMIPFEPVVGILAGLGLSVLSETTSKPLDSGLRPVAERLDRMTSKNSLAMLIKLDEDIKSKYQG